MVTFMHACVFMYVFDGVQVGLQAAERLLHTVGGGWASRVFFSGGLMDRHADGMLMCASASICHLLQRHLAHCSVHTHAQALRSASLLSTCALDLCAPRLPTVCSCYISILMLIWHGLVQVDLITGPVAPSTDNGSTAIEVALKMAFRKFMAAEGLAGGGGELLELQVCHRPDS